MMKEVHYIEPALGEGIYLVKDVSKILNIDYSKTYRWITGYWNNAGLDEDTQYTFGDVGNRAINFLSLIEFYTFFRLREQGLTTTEIRKLHTELSDVYGTRYPFAVAQDFYIEKSKKAKKFVYYDYLESLVKANSGRQISLRFVAKFLKKVEFDDNNLAVRLFPLADSKNVVVDPKRQFGQPIVSGTSIKTETIYGLFNGGESLENISTLYNISIEKVRDAIAFQKAA